MSRSWELIRRIRLPAKSTGSSLYLISVGMIAIWIIAVFFGGGLFSLIHRSAERASEASAIDAEFAAPGALGASVLEAKSGTLVGGLEREPNEISGNSFDRSLSMPGKPQILAADRAIGLGDGITRVDVGAAQPNDEVAPALRTEIQPAGGIGPQLESPYPSTTPARKRRPPANNRSVQTHAPVQAIHQLLQKHSRLLE